MRTPTPEQLQYMQSHIQDTRVPGIIATCAICLPLATLAVSGRFIARLRGPRKVELQSSDWLVLAALLFLVLLTIGFIQTMKYGMGRHAVLVTNPKMFTVWILVAETMVTLSTLAVKTSLCTLYMQIFPYPWIRWTSISTVCLTVTYTIGHILSDFLQCIPLAALWDPSIQNAWCFRLTYQAVAMAIINIVTDIIILVIPLKPIWELMISTTRKWQLSVILSLGTVACAVGGIRIPFMQRLSSADISWDIVPGAIVYMVEPTVAIIAACLPACRPLLSRMLHISLGVETFYSRPRSLRTFSSSGNSRVYELAESNGNQGVTKDSTTEGDFARTGGDEERLVVPTPVHLV